MPDHTDAHLDLAAALLPEAGLPEPVTSIAFLDAGYSTDRKYVLRGQGGSSYLLRISDLAEEHVRRANFEFMSRLWEVGVACPRPFSCGANPALGVCFMVLAYLPGDCAEDALPAMPSTRQYAIGQRAGKELAKIHSALAPTQRVDDYAASGGKYLRRLQAYRDAEFRFEGQHNAERYAAAHLDLLRDRPTVFRHGDYHPGNLIVQDDALVGVVDFNRCDWGDPVEEFYKLAFFGAPLSEAYARGQITGYFQGEPPDGFWQLYNLYVAMALPADVVWTQQYYPQHLSDSLKRIEEIASTHDLEKGGPPAWWVPPRPEGLP